LDADRSFSEYGIEAVPTLIYVDKEGKARGCDLGFAEGKETEIERKIKELLGP
jgi:hypothetical protein